MRERTRDWLRKCLTIALGVLVMSVAYNMFLVPAKIAPGGVSGAATIVYYLTGLPIGAVSLAMNMPLFILGWRQEGRDFIVRTLLSTVLLSLALDTLKFPRITEDPMLSALFGGVILGLGLGLVFMSDATTGGTDLAAKMIQRRLPRLSMAWVLFGLDMIVTVAAMIAFSPEEGLYALITIYVGTKIAQKAPDESHPYGHDRFECLASVVLGAILLATGFGIGYGGVTALISGSAGATAPGTIALVAAAVSILIKEAMFQYTRHHARRIKSSAFEADAWHHRSDALSSVGALIGIGASMAGFPAGDALASIVICLFIFKVAYEVVSDAVNNLLDTPCDPQVEASIRTTIQSVPGIERIDLLRTRSFGSKVYVDAEVAIDGTMTLEAAHDIVEQAHDQVEQDFPDVKHIMIHPNPL